MEAGGRERIDRLQLSRTVSQGLGRCPSSLQTAPPGSEFAGDCVCKLVKRLSPSDAGGWFDFSVRKPAPFVPGFCRLCESPRGEPSV